MTDEVYVPKKHIVRPKGVIFNPKIESSIKVYTMVPESEDDFCTEEIRKLNGAMQYDLSSRNIPRQSGIGFSIISNGFLNICIWGEKIPSVLHQSIYIFERKDIDSTLEGKTAEEAGSFCCWEGAIVGHESAAWRHYLLSRQSELDLEAYLANRFEGLVE